MGGVRGFFAELPAESGGKQAATHELAGFRCGGGEGGEFASRELVPACDKLDISASTSAAATSPAALSLSLSPSPPPPHPISVKADAEAEVGEGKLGGRRKEAYPL